MADDRKIYQLVNEAGQSPLDVIFGDYETQGEYHFCDWDVNGNGYIRRIHKQEGIVQTTLKIIFTERQRSGYGSNIYSFVGEKEVGARRMSIFMDITLAIMTLKSFIDREAFRQNISADDLIATVGKLVVSENEIDPSSTKINMTLVSGSDELTAVDIL